MSDTYRSAGVDYDVLDPAKRHALTASAATSPLLEARGGRAIDASRGEPAFLFEVAGRTYAQVLECLGTKSVLAREVQHEIGLQRFDAVAYDSVAAIVNDLGCVGAAPLVVNAYFATGSAEFYADQERFTSLVDGWQRACEDAGAVWGGGESPTLSGLIHAADIELAGSAVGLVPEGHEGITGQALAPGDDIVLVAATGLHANGASLARRLAGDMSEGYATELPSGRTFGDALLDPAPVYSRIVERVLGAGGELTYVSHITGHGFRKLMRADRDLGYVLDVLLPVPEVLAFMVERLGLSDEEAYGTFNMGAGYALYCPPSSTAVVLDVCAELGFDAQRAGRVVEGPRRLEITPLGVTYRDDSYSAR